MKRSYLCLTLLLCVVPTLYGCIAAVVGGAATAVVTAEDRRTVGTITDDQGIEIKSASRIGDKYPNVHVNSTSYNRVLLLTGEVTDAAAKTGIEQIARSIENVRSVDSELVIAANSSLSSRANDSSTTVKVKARFIDQQKFNAVHVKVVTEANVVYLMGLVTHKEADDAVQITRTTSGVQKVVKLFEYTD